MPGTRECTFQQIWINGAIFGGYKDREYRSADGLLVRVRLCADLDDLWLGDDDFRC